MLKGFPGNISELFQQAQKLQENFSTVQAELEKKEVEASAGGGMVIARANGKMEIVAISIDQSIVDQQDREMLQDLVRAAVNESLRKAKDLLKDEMGKVTGGLNIPFPGFGA